MLIHAPDVYPETSILTEVIQPGKTVTLEINPYFVESKQNVKDLKLSQRMCLFPDEVTYKLHTSEPITIIDNVILKFFIQKSLTIANHYDHEQCITECRVQTILNTCNCIPFIYPYKMNSSVICDLTDALCMYNNAGKRHVFKILSFKTILGKSFNKTTCVGNPKRKSTATTTLE